MKDVLSLTKEMSGLQHRREKNRDGFLENCTSVFRVLCCHRSAASNPQILKLRGSVQMYRIIPLPELPC